MASQLENGLCCIGLMCDVSMNKHSNSLASSDKQIDYLIYLFKLELSQ